MKTSDTFKHYDPTTEEVAWPPDGAQPPAGVPHNYGDVDWKTAAFRQGPPVMFWNFGLMPSLPPSKCDQTARKIRDLMENDKVAWLLTGDNGRHETGPGSMQRRLQEVHTTVHQRLGYAAIRMPSPFHPRSVAQPHGVMRLIKLMKAGDPKADSPSYEWRRMAFMDVLVDGAECFPKGSEDAATADRAVPLRLVATHTVSSSGDRAASHDTKVMMILRAIECGLACRHPNWICSGDYNVDVRVMAEACALAAKKFGLASVPVFAGDEENGKDFFISPFEFKFAKTKDTRTKGFGDAGHNAILVKVPMMVPRRGYQGDVVVPPLQTDFFKQHNLVQKNVPKQQPAESQKRSRSDDEPEGQPPPKTAPSVPRQRSTPSSPAASDRAQAPDSLPAASAPMAVEPQHESAAESVAGSAAGEDATPGEGAMPTTTSVFEGMTGDWVRSRPDLHANAIYPPTVETLAAAATAEPAARAIIGAFGLSPEELSETSVEQATAFVATIPNTVIGSLLSGAVADADMTVVPTEQSRPSDMEMECSPAPTPTAPMEMDV